MIFSTISVFIIALIAAFVVNNPGLAPVTATITVTPSFTNGGVTCTGTIRTFTITVNPTVQLNQPASQTVCNGTATVQEVFTTIYTGGTTTYSWTNNLPGIGLPASGTGNVPSFTAINNQLVPVTATITVTPTFANGGTSCTGLPSTFTITVNPTPTITCPANITVTNDPGVCGAIVNYPPAIATGTPTPVITYSIASGTLFPVGTTTVTATATNECGTVSCDFTITVVDNEQPVISCPSNITVSAVGACTAVVTYALPTATDNCPGVVVTRTAGLASGSAFPLGVTTITHLATDAHGNTSSCSFTVTVTDGQVPSITSQPANTTVCNGATATFAVTATHAVGYQWQAWNGNSWNNIGGATSASYSVSNASVTMNTNSYRVIVIGLCNNTISAHASIYINPIPVIQVSTSGSTELLPTQQLTITATVNRSGGTYVWYKNNVLISGAAGSILANLTVDDAGTYKVVYTDTYGCTITSEELVVSAKGSENLYIYPNPSEGRFSVRFNNQSTEEVTVKVFDDKGAIVYQRKQAVARPYASIVVDLPAAGVHPSGTYLVQVVNKNGVVIGIRRIIVYH